jgi:hypothetical protein
MIWLTWRQFRGAADDYADGLAACTGRPDGCSTFYQLFFHDNQTALLGTTAVMLVLPALIGLFWGAPLITRELEAGTHRLVWNQSVTRTRWLAVKLAVVGLAATLAAGLGSLAVTWWTGPIDKSAAGNIPSVPRLGPLLFDARGIAPIGYAAFAFALGVTIGMIVHRTLPAMALTLVAFAAVQLAMPLLVRPHLLAESRSAIAITRENVDDRSMPAGGGPLGLTMKAYVPTDPGAWVLSSRLVDSSGRTMGETLPVSTASGPCAPPERVENAEQVHRSDDVCFAELKRLGYRHELTYHASSRFWTFQWVETGIFAVLSLGLAGLCFWLIRRRVS